MPWQMVEHGDFRGGENLADNETVLADNQAVLLENLMITGNGQVRKRKGMMQYPGSQTFSHRIDQLHYFLKRDGSVYNFVFSNKTLSLCTGTQLITGLDDGPYGTEIMQDKFLFVDGTDYYESDGTAGNTKAVPLPNDNDATLTEVKRCRLLAQYSGRIWAAGDSQNPRAIYYSQINRYDYFKGGGTPDMQVGVSADDAEPAQILLEIYGGLLIGKRTGWWLLTGDPALGIQTRRLIRGTGPISGAYAVVDGLDIWYIAEDGIRVLSNPDSNVYGCNLVGKEQAPLFENGDLSKAVLAYHDQRVLLSFKQSANSADNDIIAIADLRFRGDVLQLKTSIGAGTRITGWPVTAFMIRPDTGGLCGGLSSGKITKLFTGLSDLGTPITWKLTTPRYTAGEATLRKMYDGVTIHVAIAEADSGFLSHTATVDLEQIRATVPFRRGETKQFVAFRPRLVGTHIQHELQSTSEGDVSIVTLGEAVRPLRLMRRDDRIYTF